MLRPHHIILLRLLTERACVSTAVCEPTPYDVIVALRHNARNRYKLPVGIVADRRHGIQQCLRVRMCRMVKQLFGRRPLDHLSGIHYEYPVRHVCHDSDVMCDQNHRHPGLLLQLFEQIHNLCLNCHIQRRRRLIGDQKTRIAGKRHRNHHTLAHTSGKGMRIFFHDRMRIRHADPGKQRLCPHCSFLF